MAQSLSAACPKCQAEMIYVTSVPHPRSYITMRRTTFVCYGCNQTRSYSLSPDMAEAYAAAYGRPGPTVAGNDVSSTT